MWWEAETILIGKECMLADGVDIWNSDTHSIFDDEILYTPPKNITIGEHVWIGKDVAVLKGTSIGNNAVIGMKSVLTRDVPMGCVAAGNPARIIKEAINWNRSEPGLLE